MNDALETKKYIEACRETFRQRVFAVEVDYLCEKLLGCSDVLSVGCGPAFIEGELAAKGYRVTGLDISQEALKCAPDSIRTMAGRAEDLSFPESSFDAAIFVASLQFIEDYRAALNRAAAALKPDGRIIAMLLNPASEFYKDLRRKPDES